MAILESIPGITVSIRIDENLVEEYDNPDDKAKDHAEKTVTKYIQATSNSNYCIEIIINAPYKMAGDALSAKVYIDNHQVAHPRFERYERHEWRDKKNKKHKRKEVQQWYRRVDGVEEYDPLSGHSTLKRFKFLAIETVDDADNARIERELRTLIGLGEIRIDFHRLTNSKEIEQKADAAPENAPQSLAEKADKGRGLTHGTSFGVAEPCAKRRVYSSDYLDGKDQPCAVFIFKYRSRVALQRLLLIPRTPSPDPFDQLSEQEIRELAREKFLDRRAPNVKKEIKSEDRGVKRGLSSVNEIESIDLTGDSMVITKVAKKAKSAPTGEIIDLD